MNERIKSLVMLAVGDKMYLGKMDETAATPVIREAVDLADGMHEAIDQWLVNYNEKTLKTVRLGEGIGYTVTELCLDSIAVLRRRCEDMDEVKRTAVMRLERSYFEK